MTENKQAEEQRLALERRFQQTHEMEALGRLAGDIAHDLNNTLFTMLGFAELLQEDLAKAAPEALPHVEEILRGCERARGLADQILTFSRKARGEAIAVRNESGKEVAPDGPSPCAPEGAVEASPAEMAGELPSGTERILLVDDEEVVLMLLSRILTPLGYHVTTRPGGPAALDAFRAAPDGFDLVVTDLTMPELTGLELTERIREVRPDMPMILCTGHDNQATRDRVEAYRFREFIAKPIQKRELARAIRRVLDEPVESGEND